MSEGGRPSIVVVGAGPVGMTAALGLAGQGVPVTVLEAGADLATETRASTFHPPSLGIMRELGIVDELIEMGIKAPGFQYRGYNRQLIAHLDMSVLEQDTDYPYRLHCEQSKLTHLIRRHLEHSPNVTLRFGAEVERVEIGTGAARVFLAGDGFEPSYTAGWVLGADGANSAVRRSLGVAFEGITYPERFLVISTTHDFCDDIPDLAPVNYVYDPADWGVLLRTPSHWRALFPIDPGQSSEEVLDPDHIQARLQGLVTLPEPYPVVHSTVYALHQRVAATFGLGQVLLLGDAAHINNPLGGMGMNSGIQDAHAAVQALLYAMAGGDPKRAVETYARVRRDAAMLDVQKSSHRNYEQMREADARQREAVRANIVETANDPRRARAYLRVTSMLASFETSQRRMRRGLTPVRGAAQQPAGQRLSDALRDWSLPRQDDTGPLTAAVLAAAEVPSCSDDLAALTAGARVPVVAAVAAGADVAAAVARFERANVSAIEVAGASSTRAAIAARNDLLVIATVDASGAGPSSVGKAAAELAEAGADVIALTGPANGALLEAVHRAVPHVPLATTAGSDVLPEPLGLILAGVGLLLDRSAALSATGAVPSAS
jgi:2-polyprenyl-6-methoxyphenol hydroxylase-like FAD-dependent oxidoreductase